MIRKLFSLVCVLLFFNSIVAQTITAAEYYFDTEPGVGNAISVNIPNQAEISNESYTIDISALEVGFHVLYFRTKDNNNVWGLYDKRTFYVTKAYTSTTDKITAAEYYFDTEVGLDKATKVTLSANESAISDSFAIDVSALTAGFHTFHFRVQSDKGLWSLYDKRTFYVSAQNTFTKSEITKAEYFFDNEVGVGNGTALTLNETGTQLSEVFDIDISSLKAGFHTMHIRVMNADNVWSLYDKRTFYVTAQNTLTKSEITKAEYFFDNEVGVGNGIPLMLNETGTQLSDVFDIDITALEKGFHTIYIRVMNADNIWSVYDKRTFYISESFTADVSKIIKAEYFFNTIVANGAGTEITLPTNLNDSFETQIATTGLSEGNHLLFIRIQNEAGIWSLYDVVAFEINNTLGTEDIAAAVSLYPNPAKNYININTVLDLQSYQIYDVSGKIVQKNNSIEKQININQLANGVYFLVLSSEKGKIVKKIVKE